MGGVDTRECYFCICMTRLLCLIMCYEIELSFYRETEASRSSESLTKRLKGAVGPGSQFLVLVLFLLEFPLSFGNRAVISLGLEPGLCLSLGREEPSRNSADPEGRCLFSPWVTAQRLVPLKVGQS